MDASQYKDYVLFMLFIKYVSDKYGDSDDFAPPVTIPKGASFNDMVALKGDRSRQQDQHAGHPATNRCQLPPRPQRLSRLQRYWGETMQDDCYLVAAEGWKTGADVRLARRLRARLVRLANGGLNPSREDRVCGS